MMIILFWLIVGLTIALTIMFILCAAMEYSFYCDNLPSNYMIISYSKLKDKIFKTMNDKNNKINIKCCGISIDINNNGICISDLIITTSIIEFEIKNDNFDFDTDEIYMKLHFIDYIKYRFLLRKLRKYVENNNRFEYNLKYDYLFSTDTKEKNNIKNEMKNNDINDLVKNIIKQYENDNTSTENKVTPIGFIIDK